jgi:hypothetical protein
VTAKRKAWVCGRSLAGIVGSNPAGNMDVCRLRVLCFIRWSLRLAERWKWSVEGGGGDGLTMAQAPQDCRPNKHLITNLIRATSAKWELIKWSIKKSRHNKNQWKQPHAGPSDNMAQLTRKCNRSKLYMKMKFWKRPTCWELGCIMLWSMHRVRIKLFWNKRNNVLQQNHQHHHQQQHQQHNDDNNNKPFPST